MTRLIFYKANRGQWLDKLVAFLDGGDHLVLVRPGSHLT